MRGIKVMISMAILSVIIMGCVTADPKETPPGELEQIQASSQGDTRSIIDNNKEPELNDISANATPSATCPLLEIAPCQAGLPVCAVRCCNDDLHTSFQLCGNCFTWAQGACIRAGGPKRVRWQATLGPP